MEALQNEWKATCTRPLDLKAIDLARQQRTDLEAQFDAACLALLQENSVAWGRAALA
jgi:hypothetical protein